MVKIVKIDYFCTVNECLTIYTVRSYVVAPILVAGQHYPQRPEAEIRRNELFCGHGVCLVPDVCLCTLSVDLHSVEYYSVSGIYAGSYTALAVVGQHILLIYHIICRKYLLYTVVTPKQEDAVPGRRREHHGAPLTRKAFEAYFREEKPWLDSNFKITGFGGIEKYY